MGCRPVARARPRLPGLKFVEGRATRYITDSTAAGKVLQELGLNPYSEPSLLGITALEKQLKGLGLKVADTIGAFVAVKKSEPVLVGEDDRRPTYDPTSGAKQDFA